MTDAWRPLAATLADEARRLTWARVVTGAAQGTPLDASVLSARERRAVDALVRAGLAELADAGVLPRDPFGPLLERRPAAAGIDRFLRAGRITAWPKRPVDRAALLTWAGGRAVTEDEVRAGQQVPERRVTERLSAVSDDPATLRRDLVDAGLREREPDGSAYRHPTWPRAAHRAAHPSRGTPRAPHPCRASRT